MDWNLKGGGKRYCFLSYHLEVEKVIEQQCIKVVKWWI
jgi:hypothetical protein